METKIDSVARLTITMEESDAQELLTKPEAIVKLLKVIAEFGHMELPRKKNGRNGHGRKSKVATGPKVAGRRARVTGSGGASVATASKWPCAKCGRSFGTSKRLSRHVALKHPELAPAARA